MKVVVRGALPEDTVLPGWADEDNVGFASFAAAVNAWGGSYAP